ncbi:MAG TPA: hypothetical protein VK498_14910, partial [Ferruginibacter sp.]|nr:hypothetical protein [Ferruginibacter sp.]
IDISEAKNISMTTMKLKVKDTNPVVDLHNSSNISFNKVSMNEEPVLIFRIGGDRTGNIKWINSTDTKNKLAFEFGAKENALIIQ